MHSHGQCRYLDTCHSSDTYHPALKGGKKVDIVAVLTIIALIVAIIAGLVFIFRH